MQLLLKMVFLGFYLNLGYALIVMAYDVLIILFILVFLDWYEKLIGVTLSIPEDEDGSTKEAKNIVGWALFGFKCFIIFAFVLVIITELCFICLLRRKIKIFDA